MKIKVKIIALIFLLVFIIFIVFKFNNYKKLEENKVYVEYSENLTESSKKLIRKDAIKKGEDTIKKGFGIDFKRDDLNEKVVLRDVGYTPIWSIEWNDTVQNIKYFVDIDINSSEILTACVLRDEDIKNSKKKISRKEIYSILESLIKFLNLDIDKDDLKIELTNDGRAIVILDDGSKYYEFHININKKELNFFYNGSLKKK